LEIVGDMADKIKNNVKEELHFFSWKLTFPKELQVDTIPEKGIMILNQQMKRVRTEFTINPKENSIKIAPAHPYKPREVYFFYAKCQRKKEICIAFVMTEDNKMQTFDQKTSREKMTAISRREAKKAERLAKMGGKE